MKNKRVFVSGGSGVIGLELVPRLVSLGAIVLVGDLKPRPENFDSEILYRQGDLNYITQEELVAFAPDIFIHLAATFERSSESYEFWEENFHSNIHLSHHLMTLVKDLPSLKRVVFASSYLIYDPILYQFESPQDKPVSLKETDNVQPRNLTGMSKFAHEIELRFINNFCADRFSTVCARIYRGYGRNSRDVISRWVRCLIRNESITVYRPEGFFDYIFAADTAEGLIRLANCDHVTGVINLGTGRSRKVKEIVEVLKNYFPNLKVRTVESDIPFEASQANMDNFRKLVGWEPVYTLEKGIEEIISFERARIGSASISIVPKINVLITSSASKVPLIRAMKVAVKKIDPNGLVFAGDGNAHVVSRYVADDFWHMPLTQDDFLSNIIAGLKERAISFVLPTRDAELIFWARHADRLKKEGITVIVSESEHLKVCLDKFEFSQFGSKNRLPFIPTSFDIERIQSEMFVVKERYGAGSRSIGLQLNSSEAKLHAQNLVNPIFQPYINGLEISIDAWIDREYRVRGLVTRRRDKVVNGESQITTTFSDKNIEEQSRVILESLKLKGPVVMQAILDVNKGLSVIECNPRFGGASTASIAAGLDSLYWSLSEAIDSSLTPSFHRTPGEVMQIRIPSDIYVSSSDF
jgi:carbamoyl-phosphate synthase large subunit